MDFFVFLIISLVIILITVYFTNNSSSNNYESYIRDIAEKDKIFLYQILNSEPNKILDTNNNLLVVDFETTGLPIDPEGSISDLNNWPFIVSATLLLYDKNGVLLDEYNTLLKQSLKIPERATQIHKITTEEANEKGVDFKIFHEKLLFYSKNSTILCAHNIDFDYKILQVELRRNKLKNCFSKHKKICTLKFGKKHTRYRYNLMRLTNELYPNIQINNITLHNSNYDARLTAACFFKLMNLHTIDSEIFEEIL